VILSRKGANSPTGRKLRSTGTKARARVDPIRESRTELYQQLKACRRELAEAREQQRATSEVLGIISSSPSDLGPVFQAMLANAVHVCAAQFGQENIWQFMRQNWLSNRIFKSFDDIVDHCCYAWNTLIDQPWKIMSIARRDWAAAGHSI